MNSVEPISFGPTFLNGGSSTRTTVQGNVQAFSAPWSEAPGTAELQSNGAENWSTTGSSASSNPTITYETGNHFQPGDPRNYLPELASLGQANTETNFGMFSDVGNGVPSFANPPALPSVIGATSGGVTSDTLAQLAPSATVANEFAEAADPNPTGLVAALNNSDGLNMPLGPQVDFQAVDPVSSGQSSDSTGGGATSSSPNLLFFVIVAAVVGLGYWAYKSGKLKEIGL